jgi:hypothetical protein
MMDVWIIAIVTNSTPAGPPPVATLFAVEAPTQQDAETLVDVQIGAPILSRTTLSLAPHLAQPWNMKPGEVRQL